MGDEVLAAHRLAGFRPAHLQHPPVDGAAPEVMVEADHAERLGPGDVERVRQQRDGVVVDIAELMLEIVQDRQRRSGRRSSAGDQFTREFNVESRPCGHHRSSR